MDLGLFETRETLFSALKQYQNKEAAAGRLIQKEADVLFSGITFPVRNVD